MASMDHKAKFSSPSFSSTLLDAIYRSIDNSEEQEEGHLVVFKESMRKKQSQEDMANYQRACLIEKWMEKKRGSEYDASSFFNSSSSSSDFSSYEADSVYGVNYQSSSSCYGLNNNKPKPIRTTVSSIQEKDRSQKPKTGGFVNTKSRALKIYTELKKARQPISPGGRLATFLNSIFTPGNATKKAKVSSKIDSEKKTKSANASTCSSASSFSRSCLSKTPSSANGLKRSVRFYPVSVIVDEDCQPCGQKSLYDDNLQQKQQQKTNKNMDLDLDLETVKKNIRAHVLEKNLRVEDLLRNFQVKKHEDEDEEDDDAASYASSDLFELDNLSAIGMDHHRYHEELPVYETTHLGTNRAIAKGLIL